MQVPTPHEERRGKIMQQKRGSGGGDAAAAAVDDAGTDYSAVYDGVYDECEE